MSETAIDRLLILFSAGVGLMVLGGLNYLLNGQSRRLRMSLGGCAAIACTLAPLSIASAQVSAISFGVILLGMGFLAAITAPRVASLFQSVTTFARRPSVHAAILVGSGVVLMAASLTHFESEEEASFNRDMAWMAESISRPPSHLSTEDSATTDAGNTVGLHAPDVARSQEVITSAEQKVLSSFAYSERLIRLQPASDVCNCHGWVFTGGRYWISPEDVEQALKENGYQPVSDPRAGDVVIYRQGQMISHTAIVRTSGPGEPLLVEGKWGWMGVFLHRIDDSPYGRVHELYRSTRGGHVLHGLEERPAE